ncbi:MAG: peptide chain release factor N(5)-glutamine methyltransferase [Hyphomicrobiales bacterium]|nr:MAG: peptide chain release factor N(5)-glutamine methyltransferase [Hyphomicrobiales bacterium]
MKPKSPSRVDQASTQSKGGPSHDQDVFDDSGDRADGAGDDRRFAGSGAHLPQDDVRPAGRAAGCHDAVAGAQGVPHGDGSLPRKQVRNQQEDADLHGFEDERQLEPVREDVEPLAGSTGNLRGECAVPTVREVRRLLAQRFLRAGSASPGLDARLLVEGTVGAEHLDPSMILTAEALARLDDVSARRIAGEPVWRILGEREFWGLRFRLSPATLEPRPDSETIVEAALAQLASRREEDLALLDLGTGTGCLLIALLCELKQAHGLGVDLSEEACRTAAGNAALNGVDGRATFRQGNWTEGLDGRFDLIVSNPPYIPTPEIATLSVEVREHDPVLALDGGADGLGPYRLFSATLQPLLAPGGVIVLEIGAGQGPDVVALMRSGGFEFRGSRNDLGGHERALVFTLA